MIFSPTPLQGCYTVELEPFSDERGWFARYYCSREFEQIGHVKPWVQLNHSFTNEMGTLRGMHFQLPPFKEVKLVRCIAGKIYDVVIDLRKDSATFLKWFGVELSAQNKKMIYIPEGFAHGFQTLSENCELLYHHSEFYTPGAEGGIMYNDPMVSVQWPLTPGQISQRDREHPLLNTQFKGI